MKLWQLHYTIPAPHASIVHWCPTEKAARDERKRLCESKEPGWVLRPRDFTIQPVEVPTTDGREALCFWLNERDVETRRK